MLTQSTCAQIFTATSVSEAAKSSQLNHYILVFTVVTIFYLPLSFVAVSTVTALSCCWTTQLYSVPDFGSLLTRFHPIGIVCPWYVQLG